LNLISRRAACCGIATAFGLGAGLTSSQGHRVPFCGYSIKGGWTDEARTEYITRRARKEDPSGIPQVVAQIKDSLNIRVDFDVYIARDENNAFATVANGRKILVVDVDFLDELNRLTGTQWSAIQVIAHEVGHHIAGFMDDRHRGELSADYWSGQALQRLGSSMEAAQTCILTVGSDHDSASHPNKRRRAATIERGWNDASQGKVDYSFCLECR